MSVVVVEKREGEEGELYRYAAGACRKKGNRAVERRSGARSISTALYEQGVVTRLLAARQSDDETETRSSLSETPCHSIRGQNTAPVIFNKEIASSQPKRFPK